VERKRVIWRQKRNVQTTKHHRSPQVWHRCCFRVNCFTKYVRKMLLKNVKQIYDFFDFSIEKQLSWSNDHDNATIEEIRHQSNPILVFRNLCRWFLGVFTDTVYRSCFRQTVPSIDNPHWKEIFPNVLATTWLAELQWVSSCTTSGVSLKEPF